MVMRHAAAGAAILLLSACAAHPPAAPADRFVNRITALCGKAFAGRITTTDPADADMAGKPLVMHVARCDTGSVRIPFHVGEDRSRTWVLSRRATGLELKHDHRRADGTPDPVTLYGGTTTGPGSAMRQEFPVDADTIALFRAQGLGRSLTNVWAIEASDTRFAYELRRPGRHFRVEFDLEHPIALPPPAWAARDSRI